MPVRFRKTFKIFPGIKANVSKSGVSFTIGTKGYHLNFSKRGVKQTVGLPGSGISHSSFLVKNDGKSETETKRDNDTTENDAGTVESKDESLHVTAQRRTTPEWVVLLGLVVIYVGAVMLGLIPVNFLSQVLQTLTEWARGIGL